MVVQGADAHIVRYCMEVGGGCQVPDCREYC